MFLSCSNRYTLLSTISDFDKPTPLQAAFFVVYRFNDAVFMFAETIDTKLDFRHQLLCNTNQIFRKKNGYEISFPEKFRNNNANNKPKSIAIIVRNDHHFEQ